MTDSQKILLTRLGESRAKESVEGWFAGVELN